MASKLNPRKEARLKRKRRIRTRISGSAERPRLSVFRTSRHIYAQVIDDTEGCTLVAASTQDAEVRKELEGKDKSAQAAVVGEVLAERAQAAGIKQIVFDRGGYKYHGRVKSLAEAARKSGLDF